MDTNSEGGSIRRSASSSPKVNSESPYSPFPFGSPLTCSSRSVLSPSNLSLNGSRTSSSLLSSLKLPNRHRGEEYYSRPIMFGGGNSSFRSGGIFSSRKERLLSSSPYQRSKPRKDPEHQKSSSLLSSDAMSSSAKIIFDTLDRMSTPLNDAKKIPVTTPMSRAEKRRILAEELDSSLQSSSSSSPHSSSSKRSRRRRPDLSSGVLGRALNGPPLRTLFSPVAPNPNRILFSESIKPSYTSGEVNGQSMGNISTPNTMPNPLTMTIPPKTSTTETTPSTSFSSKTLTQCLTSGIERFKRSEEEKKDGNTFSNSHFGGKIMTSKSRFIDKVTNAEIHPVVKTVVHSEPPSTSSSISTFTFAQNSNPPTKTTCPSVPEDSISNKVLNSTEVLTSNKILNSTEALTSSKVLNYPKASRERKEEENETSCDFNFSSPTSVFGSIKVSESCNLFTFASPISTKVISLSNGINHDQTAMKNYNSSNLYYGNTSVMSVLGNGPLTNH